jgi:hypothetical protein
MLDNEIAQVSYIRRHWNDLAAFAWLGHEMQGRGVLWITTAYLENEEELSMAYVSLDEMTPTDPLHQAVRRLVANYRPAIEIVVVFVDAHGRTSSYKRASANGITPLQAYTLYNSAQ